MFMNRFILFSAVLFFSPFVHADSASKDAKGFITHKDALHCMQLNKDVVASQQQLLSFATGKANLKSKIDYLQNQIQIRRRQIEELDQKNYQDNNKNYNQLIDQFESLMAERKQTIALYDKKDRQHQAHNQQDIKLQNTYTEQCLNHIKITKQIHKDACQQSNSRWCSKFKF